MTKQLSQLIFLTLLSTLGVLTNPVSFGEGKTIARSLHAQTVQEKKQQADRLFQEGLRHNQANQFREAAQSYQEALRRYQNINHRAGISRTLNNLGKISEKLGDDEQAINYYQRSLAISKAIDDRAGMSASYNNLGIIYHRSLGKYEKALDYYQRSLAIDEAIDDRAGMSASYNNLGIIYRSLGKYQEALNYHQRALVIKKEISDRAGMSRSLNNLGIVAFSLANYEEAINYFQQALEIVEEMNARAGVANSLNNLGNVAFTVGNYQEAMDYYQRSLAIKEEISNQAGMAASLNNLGGVSERLGQYQQAINYHQRSLAIKEEISDRAGVAASLNNLGNVSEQLGKYQEAMDYHQRSLAIFEQLGNRTGMVTSVNNLGHISNLLEDYEQAMNYHQRSLKIAEEMRDRAGIAMALGNLGMVANSLGNYEDAIHYSQKSLGIFRELGNPTGMSRALNNLGLVAKSLGNYEEAIDYFQGALGIAKEISDRAGEANSLNNLGLTFLLGDQLFEAKSTYLQALKVFESLRVGLDDSDKVSLIETQAEAYNGLQRVLVERGEITSALEVSERSRARVFVELLARVLSPSENSSPTVTFPNIKQIREIAREQNATLVQYSQVLEDTFYIWVIQPSGAIEFRKTTVPPSLSFEAHSSPVRQRQALKRNHERLIAPIADLLPKDPEKRVIFIPDGRLFFLPFPALQDKDGTYLIEKHTILTAPAIQVLDLTRDLRKETNHANAEHLIVGNPTMPTVQTSPDREAQTLYRLPGAEREAIAIAQLNHTQALLGEQATESIVVEQMPKARVIHLATHGLLNYGIPEASLVRDVPGAIALAPSDTDDGLLTSAEILELNLNAELVVLSACDTGRGRITSDGVIGLSRSLITAGVPSVVVSLWSIPDAPTAELMTEFYHQLEQTPDKAQALRQAMLKTIETHPNPVNWAGFTLIGEAR